jgi:hypothetical protein
MQYFLGEPGKSVATVGAAATRQHCNKILSSVKVAVRGLSNPDSHVGVCGIQDVASMVLLKSRLVHQVFFRVSNSLVEGNVLRQSAPLDSGGVDSVRGRPALTVNMGEVPAAKHVAGMRKRDGGQFVVPPKGPRPAMCFRGVCRVLAVAVDEHPHLLCQTGHAGGAGRLKGY